MRYTYYPGCSLHSTGIGYDKSMRAVFAKLGEVALHDNIDIAQQDRVRGVWRGVQIIWAMVDLCGTSAFSRRADIGPFTGVQCCPIPARYLSQELVGGRLAGILGK